MTPEDLWMLDPYVCIFPIPLSPCFSLLPKPLLFLCSRIYNSLQDRKATNTRGFISNSSFSSTGSLFNSSDLVQWCLKGFWMAGSSMRRGWTLEKDRCHSRCCDTSFGVICHSRLRCLVPRSWDYWLLRAHRLFLHLYSPSMGGSYLTHGLPPTSRPHADKDG